MIPIRVPINILILILQISEKHLPKLIVAPKRFEKFQKKMVKDYLLMSFLFIQIICDMYKAIKVYQL